MKKIEVKWFQFMEWKDAFQYCKDNWAMYEDQMQLVISTDPYSSGYWVEPKGTKLTKGDFLYDSYEAICNLRQRIEVEMQRAIKLCTRPRFTV